MKFNRIVIVTSAGEHGSENTSVVLEGETSIRRLFATGSLSHGEALEVVARLLLCEGPHRWMSEVQCIARPAVLDLIGRTKDQ